MAKHLLIFFLFSIGCCQIFAQVIEAQVVTDKVIKYGQIDSTEFATKLIGQDSAASAIKIFDKGDLRFELNSKTGGFRYVFVKHTRIIILNKDAYDLANIEIGLYKGSSNSEEVLMSFNAATYNIENGKISTFKIGKDAKFSDRFDKNTTIRKFTLPNIKEGSIIEYKYEIRSDFIFALRDWSFQSSIPTLISDFKFTIPEYFTYKKHLRGYVPILLVENREKIEDFNARIQGLTGPAETISLTCKSNLQRYISRNVPALKSEAFITTLDDYTSKIEFELSSTQFPNSVYKSYTSTWEQIVKNLDEDENFGGLLKNSNFVRNLSETIIKGETDKLKKLNLIHTFIKKNIKYNGKESIYSSETSIKNIVEQKTGNAADVNLILIKILQEAGLKSYPILLSTRSNGIHPGYPMISKFNYVIAGVTVDSTDYFLDATDINNGPNMFAFNCLNHQGLALDMIGKKADWLSIELKKPSQNYINYRLKLSPENVFTGHVYERKTEFEGFSTREKYKNSASEEDFLSTYKKDRNGLKIDSFRIKNLDSLSFPVIMEYKAIMEDMVEEAGNLVYFTPLLYERTKENPFKLEERNFSVDFGYASEEVYHIIIDIPANFAVEKLPVSQLFKLIDNSASFSYLAKSDGKSISIVSKIYIGKSNYDPASYFDLKELFKKIVSKQAEQIVLKKI